jgi:VanZ family protein
MSKFVRWIPAILMMAIIFIASATPSTKLPNYGFWDTLFKKGGHMTGYGLLAWAYWYGLRFDRKKGWLAWLLAVLYAATDEFHQSSTPGRHPSPVDVLLFDGGGAAIALSALAARFRFRKQKSGCSNNRS